MITDAPPDDPDDRARFEASDAATAFDLDLDDEKPEGIGFESADRLVIVTDASARLLRYALDR